MASPLLSSNGMGIRTCNTRGPPAGKAITDPYTDPTPRLHESLRLVERHFLDLLLQLLLQLLLDRLGARQEDVELA